MTWQIVGLCFLAYVLGAMPFGKWIASAFGVDILREGSGNIGATNVWRTVGWRAGLPVFILDALKGYVAAFIAGQISGRPEYALLVGVFAIIGHSASIFLGFKGGKSVATALGVLFAVSPEVAAISFSVFLIVFGITRYVSVGSIAGVTSAPICAALFGYSAIIVCSYAALALFIILRHRPNIDRLRKGEEHKFSSKKRGPKEAVRAW